MYIFIYELRVSRWKKVLSIEKFSSWFVVENGNSKVLWVKFGFFGVWMGVGGCKVIVELLGFYYKVRRYNLIFSCKIDKE